MGVRPGREANPGGDPGAGRPPYLAARPEPGVHRRAGEGRAGATVPEAAWVGAGSQAAPGSGPPRLGGPTVTPPYGRGSRTPPAGSPPRGPAPGPAGHT